MSHPVIIIYILYNPNLKLEILTHFIQQAIHLSQISDVLCISLKDLIFLILNIRGAIFLLNLPTQLNTPLHYQYLLWGL